LSTGSPENLTRLLNATAAGDSAAAEQLVPAVYAELRKLARSLMAKVPPGNTLQPTALVHEAYIRLVGNEDPGWNGRGHFFGAAARGMRLILVTQARRKMSLKRGGGRRRVALDDARDADLAFEPQATEILALEDLLERLERLDPQKAEMVMLRYYSGLTVPETAAVLGVSVSTVESQWRFVRSFLRAQLADPSEES
jgi:RNA polymerase sigma factor (TIGR02999 family)